MINKNKSIVITGGHVTPALAVIEVLAHKIPEVSIVCIGRAHAFEGIHSPTNEKRLMEEKSVRFVPIEAGRVRRFFGISNLIALVKIPIGFIQAFFYLLFHKPSVILSFGGYVAVPIAVAGKLLGIPLVTHEQTASPGSGNVFLGKIADKVCVSFVDTEKFFPAGKAIMTGLPLRSSIRTISETRSVPVPEGLPILYITGGSTGAQSLNELIFPLISKLTETFAVVHQTGIVSLKKAEELRLSLPEHRRERYVLNDFFDEQDVSYFLYHARLIIGRAGANSTAEFLRTGAPTILVPLPWSGQKEQEHNAEIARGIGPVTVVHQKSATPESLMAHINGRLSKNDRKIGEQKIFFSPPDAAENVVDVLRPFIRR